MDYPIVKPIKAGWAALGESWAVHAPTREEVVELFEQAQNKHEEIMRRRDPVPSSDLVNNQVLN